MLNVSPGSNQLSLRAKATPPAKTGQLNQIFVVEAEDTIREKLVKVLQAEAYSVITASDGYAAASLLQSLELSGNKFPFDLIILAEILPKLAGLELCRWLRHQGNCVPIIVLTVEGSESSQLSVLKAGADDCLHKPFSVQKLIACCRALISRHYLNRLSKSVVLQFEGLSLYPQEHRVLVRGQEVFLSPKEFYLLKLFISYPGRVWSRQQLFEQIWGPNFVGRTKTLDVHICKLREKLELTPGQPQYIITVPRVGYRFG